MLVGIKFVVSFFYENFKGTMSIKLYLFKERLPLMQRALDTYTLRLKTTAENIANVNTVGYSPKYVKFEEYFQNSMNQIKIGSEVNTAITSELESLPEPKVETVEPSVSEQFFAGQSHVNIDREMATLAETQIKFRFVSKLLKRYFANLNSAITGIREM